MLHYEFDRRTYAVIKEILIINGFFDLAMAYQPVYVTIKTDGHQMAMVVYVW